MQMDEIGNAEMMGENSNWTIQVHAALERDEANEASQLVIWKVPSRFRDNVDLYQPLHWRFGLHHCSQNLDCNDTDAFKVELVRALHLTGDLWDDICKRVVLEPKEYWRAVYKHSRHVDSYDIEEIRCRLTLDAVSLAIILQNWGGGLQSLGPTLQRVVIQSQIMHSMWETFSLVENQIPLQLLERAVDILVQECTSNLGTVQKWKSDEWKCNISACVLWNTFNHPLIDAAEEFEVSQRRNKNWLQHPDSYQGAHILDCTYRLLCGWESLKAVHENYCPQKYSATDLQASGVTIKGKEFTYFEDIVFENGCLFVPFLRVRDTTELFLRNLVVHETLTRLDGRPQYAARCYTDFMGGLMKTPNDIMLLERLGVLSVQVGSRGSISEMWKRINANITEPYVTDSYFTMMTSMGNYAKRRRNKYRFEFKTKFCSRPWILLSYLAGAAVTVATLVELYVAIIGSDKMRPHFASRSWGP